MRILFSFCLFAVACTGPTAPDPATTDTDDTDVDIPTPVETECDDTIDDDGDGLTDCEDTDCVAVELCTWPANIELVSEITYEPNGLAQLAGYTDCTVQAVSQLARDRDQSCEGCDFVLCGAFTYPIDDCPNDPDFPRPTDGCFGFDFVSDTAWTFYGQNPENDLWEEVAPLTGPGPLSWTDTQPLDLQGTEVGDLTTTFTASRL